MAPLPGAEQQVDAQKAALLSAIAQQGTIGQQAYTANAQAQGAQHTASNNDVNASVAPGVGLGVPTAVSQALSGMVGGVYGTYAHDNSMANQSYAAAQNATNNSNAAYMDQVKAGIPIVRSQTEGTLAQIRADQEEKRQQREYEAQQRAYEEQQRQIAAQQDAEDRAAAIAQRNEEEAWAREQHGWDVEDRNATKGTPDDPMYQKFMQGLADQQNKTYTDMNVNATDGVKEVLASSGGVIETAPDYKSAVKVLHDRLLKAKEQPGEDGIHTYAEDLAAKGYNHNSALRWLWNYYNGAGTSADNAHDDLFVKQNEQAGIPSEYLDSAGVGVGTGTKARKKPPTRQEQDAANGDRFRKKIATEEAVKRALSQKPKGKKKKATSSSGGRYSGRSTRRDPRVNPNQVLRGQ